MMQDPTLHELSEKLLRNFEEKAQGTLYKFISSMYKTGQLPSDFTKRLFIPHVLNTEH